MKLIGLTGPARSGKDTTARIIYNTVFGKDYDPVCNHIIYLSFAAPIKAAIEVMCGCGYVEGPEKETVIETLGVSPRRLMQTLGTEWGRDCIGENFWVNLMEHNIKAIADDYDLGIITDARFENEAEFIREHGELWHVSRDTGQKVEAHSSENGIAFKDGDKRINNNGSIEDLTREVERCLKI